MYQTTIQSINGITATDSQGKVLYIAGNSHISQGQQVWTDGKIVYGNTTAGGGSFVPACNPYIYLFFHNNPVMYSDKKLSKNLKMLCNTSAKKITCSDRGDVRAVNEKSIDACISDEKEKPVLYELSINKDNELEIYKDSKKKATVTAESLCEELGQYVSSFPAEIWGEKPPGQGEGLSYEIKDKKYQIDKAVIHPDGSWNAFSVAQIKFEVAYGSETILTDEIETYSEDYLVIAGQELWTHKGNVMGQDTFKYDEDDYDTGYWVINGKPTAHVHTEHWFIPVKYDDWLGVTWGKVLIKTTRVDYFYKTYIWGGFGYITAYAVIEGNVDGKITGKEIYRVIGKRGYPEQDYIFLVKNCTWKLDKTTATYNPEKEKYTIEKYETDKLPLDAEKITYKDHDAWIIQTEENVNLWDGKEKTLLDAPNYNLRVRPVKNTRAKKVLRSG